MIRIILTKVTLAVGALLLTAMAASAQTDSSKRMKMNNKVSEEIFNAQEPTGNKLVRISEIEVHPEYLDEYLRFALTVGETSVNK